MKYFGLIVSFALLFLLACAPAAQQPAAPTAPAAQPPATAPAEAAPGPQPVEAKPVPAASKELQALLTRADQKLKSYKYLELILPDKKQPDIIAVKGTKIKVSLYEYDPYIPDEYFDTIYLDTVAKTATGRCENRKRCIWARGDNTKRSWDNMPYDQYRRKTPYEMLKQIPATATITGPEVHENRATTKVEYDEAGKHHLVWIDDTYGIPVEVQIVTSDDSRITYKFNDLTFNTITEADVTLK
jgi:hypothetical protein